MTPLAIGIVLATLHYLYRESKFNRDIQDHKIERQVKRKNRRTQQGGFINDILNKLD